MTPEMLTTLRKQLEEEREATIAELESYGADPNSERVKRLEGVDDNFADSAAASTERSEMLALIDQTRTRLADVEAALTRMEEGGYGTCEECGQTIAEARLEARPLSSRCVECAGRG